MIKMRYILKIYYKSKYFGFEKIEYKEFETYEEVMIYIMKKSIKYENYEIFAKVIL